MPHHLIDILEPTEDFNVVRFQALRAAAEEMASRGKIRSWQVEPALYSGTANDIDFTQIEMGCREEMERLGAEQGRKSCMSACGRSIQNRRRRSTQTM